MSGFEERFEVMSSSLIPLQTLLYTKMIYEGSK